MATNINVDNECLTIVLTEILCHCSVVQVHRITKHVCFRKNIPRPPETPAAAGSTKKAKAPKSSSLEGKSSCSKMLHFVVHCFFVYLYSSILCLLDLLS